MPICEVGAQYRIYCGAPILSEGDVLGCVLFAGTDNDMKNNETHYKLVQTIAGFLGRHMEA